MMVKEVQMAVLMIIYIVNVLGPQEVSVLLFSTR